MLALSLYSAVPALRMPAPIMQMAPAGMAQGVAPMGAGQVVRTKTPMTADGSILVQGGSLQSCMCLIS